MKTEHKETRTTDRYHVQTSETAGCCVPFADSTILTWRTLLSQITATRWISIIPALTGEKKNDQAAIRKAHLPGVRVRRDAKSTPTTPRLFSAPLAGMLQPAL